MNDDGGTQRKLVDGAIFRPSWSPNGKEIAFVDDSEKRVHVINIETGASRTLLGQTGCAASDPGWTPDDRGIVYVYKCPDFQPGDWRIAVMDARDGGHSSDLFAQQYFAVWSPDGKAVAVEGNLEVDGGKTVHGLFICRENRSNCRLLSDHPGMYPSWSPNGRLIVRHLSDGIWVNPVNGEQAFKVPGTDEGEGPTWAPDSAHIAFTDWSGGAEIAVVSLDGASRRVLAAGQLPAWQPCPTQAQ
jgi:Tol biopolymer transport system component